MSNSHTHVERPLWRGRPSACTAPAVIGRRKLVWLEWPTATRPVAAWVAATASDSAIDA